MMLRRNLMDGAAMPRPLYAADNEGGGGAGDPPASDPPAGDPPADPPAGDPPAGDPPADPPAGDPLAGDAQRPGETVKDWRDRQIARQHRQLQQERDQRVQLQNELDTARELLARQQQGGEPLAGTTPARPAAPAAPASTEQDVQRAAQALLDQQNFNNAANAAAEDGAARFKDGWVTATDRLETLGGFDRDTMNQIMATDDPAQVLYSLGSKPEEYERVMGLPPAKRLAEIVKLGLKAPAPKKTPSGAPPPAEPVGSRNRPDATELRDDLPDEGPNNWFERRQKQRDAKFNRQRAG